MNKCGNVFLGESRSIASNAKSAKLRIVDFLKIQKLQYEYQMKFIGTHFTIDDCIMILFFSRNRFHYQ